MTTILSPRAFILLFFVICLLSCSRSRRNDPVLYSDVDTIAFQKGDTVFPFDYIDSKEKGWKVVVEISGDDMNSVALPVRGRRFVTAKPNVLRLIKGWRFVYNQGDLATVTSSVLVYRNGTLVDQQGIVLDSNLVGLQSIKFGWITPINKNDIYKVIGLMDEKSF